MMEGGSRMDRHVVHWRLDLAPPTQVWRGVAASVHVHAYARTLSHTCTCHVLKHVPRG